MHLCMMAPPSTVVTVPPPSTPSGRNSTDVRCPNEPNRTQQLSDWVAAMRYYSPCDLPEGVPGEPGNLAFWGAF